MFYIKLEKDMSLVITKKEPIYRGDNLNQKIRYLVPQTVGDVDMLTASIYLNYIRADGTPDIIILERQEEKYNEQYFQYAIPVTSKLTKYAGEVCMWMQIYSGAPCNPVISKTGECLLHIMESKDMDEYLGDRQVTALYQLHRKMADGFTSVNKTIDAIVAEKADNIVFDGTDNTIQLVANGNPIGNKIVVSVNSGLGIQDMKISVDGELIVTFDDGSVKNLGKVVGSDGVVYVPHVDAHKILTFTIEDKPGVIPDPTDLNPNDEWGDIDQSSIKTDYVWETIV